MDQVDGTVAVIGLVAAAFVMAVLLERALVRLGLLEDLTEETEEGTDMDVCPECGSPITKGYRPNISDPGDVEPRADCTNPQCDWGY